MKETIVVFWFRRDLRLTDNVGLYQALQSEHKVYPLFIFDPEILDKLPKNDARVSFIHQQLQHLDQILQQKAGSSLGIHYGSPKTVFKSLLTQFNVQQVFTNRDYEPYAQKRDREIYELLQESGVNFKGFKDQVIFEKAEIVKADGKPYVVYTPYKNRWKSQFTAATAMVNYAITFTNFLQKKDLPKVTLATMGFSPSSIKVKDFTLTKDLIQNYGETRDFPAKRKGTSLLGPHLRFGTVSIRTIVKTAIREENSVFLNELIWREFFMQILWHFPHTVNQAFNPKYDRIVWRNNLADFERWKNGQTGYPLVDAGMRELKHTGHMHNRVRMLVASFLCKHLLIDWRWGEAYFAEKLLDFELSSNVGNWQWAAGSGVDAAPYFRIFNPTTQIQKFDKQKDYINQWVPELQGSNYPEPMVDHKIARERCLQVYKAAVG